MVIIVMTCPMGPHEWNDEFKDPVNWQQVAEALKYTTAYCPDHQPSPVYWE